MKALFLTTLIFVTGLTIFGQTSFQKTYGGPNNDLGLSVQQTADGGYILFGITKSFGSGDHDLYLVKTNNQGNQQWSRTYAGTSSVHPFGSVMQTSDKGYIICGSSGTNDPLVLIKTDPDGNEVWNKKFGAVHGQFVQQTSDGGFIAVGKTDSFGPQDTYMLKTDNSGNEQWSKVHKGGFAFEIKQTFDGGYGMIGGSESGMYFVKTNGSGDTTWTRTFGTSSNVVGKSLYATSDSGFILLGYEAELGGNLILVKTDSLGNEQWSNYYGGTGRDIGRSVQQTAEGGFVLVGQKENTVNGTQEMYCIKTDDTGTVEWEYTYPNGILSEASSAWQTLDGGFVLLGSSKSTVGADTDMFVVKIDVRGLVSMYEKDSPELTVSAFPNPFTEYTTLQLNGPKNREFWMNLLNSQGQIIRSINNLRPGQIKIERDNLASGLYFFQLMTGQQVVAGGKLIIK
jgi:hypothetical protein